MNIFNLKKIYLFKLIGVIMLFCFTKNGYASNLKSELRNSALLIIDIQMDYFEGYAYPLENSENVSIIAGEILNLFRNNKIKVIHIKHVSLSKDAPFFKPDTNGILIHSQVQPLNDEIVITKHDASSFINTNLDKILKNNNITTLYIIGMQTNVCVTSTSLDALKYKYNTFVVPEACAAKKISIHKNQIKELSKKGITIISFKNLKKLLK